MGQRFVWSAGTPGSAAAVALVARRACIAARGWFYRDKPESTRSYYVAIPFSGELSQVEYRPFGADDSSVAQLIWR